MNDSERFAYLTATDEWDHSEAVSEKTLLRALNAFVVHIKDGRLNLKDRQREMVIRCLHHIVCEQFESEGLPVLPLMDAFHDLVEYGRLDVDLKWSSRFGVVDR